MAVPTEVREVSSLIVLVRDRTLHCLVQRRVHVHKHLRVAHFFPLFARGVRLISGLSQYGDVQRGQRTGTPAILEVHLWPQRLQELVRMERY